MKHAANPIGAQEMNRQIRVFAGLLALTLGLLLGLGSPSRAVAEEAPAAGRKLAAVDARVPLFADDFKKSGDLEWLSPVNTPPFPFDELIYSWMVDLPEGEGFRVYFQVTFAGDEKSPWLYGGFWGKVKPFEGKREEPKFEYGEVAMDQLLLTKKAVAFQYKLVSEGDTALSKPPMFFVVTTDNKPTKEVTEQFAPVQAAVVYEPRILKLPLRKQIDSQGYSTPDRCQSAAVSSAMQFFGKALNIEDVIALTNDPEYDYPGIWPRTVGAATENGFEAYIDRFRNWQEVKAAISQNKVILASIKMPEGGQYKDPPYSSIGGHIVAINGWTEDGRVIITDSALARNDEGYMCQWLMEDFEKIWMGTKGGVGMVIVPPANAPIALYTDPVPEFPKGRAPLRDARKKARVPAEDALDIATKNMPREQKRDFENAFWDAWHAAYDKQLAEQAAKK